MANRKRPASEEDPDDIPDLTDCREYSDFLMYFAKSGRFQHHNLMDENRRKGVLTLLTAERLRKLTLERRLSPVNMSLTASGIKQRVYLVALIRSSKYIVHSLCTNEWVLIVFPSVGVTSDELDELVDIMNQYLDGMTLEEKEKTVRDLIFSTGSRVLPGVRYLPLYWYPDGTSPPDVILDDEGRNVDRDGLPILKTDDELVVYKSGKPFKRRDPRDVSLPPTGSILSDASTDSERAMPKKAQKKRVELPDTHTVQVCKSTMDW